MKPVFMQADQIKKHVSQAPESSKQSCKVQNQTEISHDFWEFFILHRV